MFIVNVYKDNHLAKILINQLANLGYEVIIIGDGVKLEDYLKQGLYFELDRAKQQGTKGLWTKRYLEIFLEHSQDDHLLKVDTDTCIWRHFVLPSGEFDLFGNIEHRKYKHPYVRGGCIGFTRNAAQVIVDSGLLLDDCYMLYTYQRYLHCRWEHEEKSDERITLQDWIVGDIAYRLGLVLKEWDEVSILGNCNKIPSVGKYAITHPHPY